MRVVISACEEVVGIRQKQRVLRRKEEEQKAEDFISRLPQGSRRAAKLASEKGASSWLTALPLDRHGFRLHKGAFRDALNLRYNWALSRLPSTYVCVWQTLVCRTCTILRNRRPCNHEA